MKKSGYKICILIVIILLIITRIYSIIRKTQSTFSRESNTILYQLTQRKSDCYYQTAEFSFSITRCEQYFIGEVLQISGSPMPESDNTQNIPKRLIIKEIKKISVKKYSLYYWKSLLFQIREKIWQYLLHPVLILLVEPHAGILLSMTLGRKEYLDKQTTDLFLKTGSTHLQVVSGYNFSVIFAGLYQATTRLAGKRVQAVLLLVAATSFVCMLGIQPSIIRAYMMLIALIFAKFVLLRQYKSLYSLLLVTLLFLYIQPIWLYSVSFQLTFAATAGIITLFPLLYTGSISIFPQENSKSLERITISGNKAIRNFLILCWEAFIVSLSAQIATFPILIWYFHQFSLSGLLVTTFLFWLIAVITLVGFWTTLFFALGYFVLPLTLLQMIASLFLWLPLEIFITFLEWVGSLEWASWGNITISKEFVIIYYFFLLLIILRYSKRKKLQPLLLEVEQL